MFSKENILHPSKRHLNHAKKGGGLRSIGGDKNDKKIIKCESIMEVLVMKIGRKGGVEGCRLNLYVFSLAVITF